MENNGCLPGTSKVVREPPSGEGYSNFRVDTDRPTDGSDEGAGSREVGLESFSPTSIVVLAVTSTDTIVPAGEHDTGSTSTELGKQVANLGSIVERDLTSMFSFYGYIEFLLDLRFAHHRRRKW